MLTRPGKLHTKKKKDELLLVLDYPNVPLHNNLAEIAVREGVIKRKITMEQEANSESFIGRIYSLYRILAGTLE